MHNWKRRREINRATFCWKRKNIFSRFIILTKGCHTCYTIKYSVTVPEHFTISETKNWNRRMEQKAKNCTKMAGAHPKPQFSVDERVFMVLEYTETDKVLETIRRFQRQFPNQRTPCRKPVMDNYVTSKDSTNSGWYWYGKKGTGSKLTL